MGKNNKENQIAELKLTDKQFLILYEIVFNFMHKDGHHVVQYLHSNGNVEYASRVDLKEIESTLSRVSEFLTAKL